MDQEIKESMNNLIKTICDSAANNSKVSTEKVQSIFNNYTELELEKETLETLLDKDYTENIKIKRGEAESAYKMYLEERTALYDTYKETNTPDSLRELLQFQIKKEKELNITNKYSNIYTKYANIRNLL